MRKVWNSNNYRLLLKLMYQDHSFPNYFYWPTIIFCHRYIGVLKVFEELSMIKHCKMKRKREISMKVPYETQYFIKILRVQNLFLKNDRRWYKSSILFNSITLYSDYLYYVITRYNEPVFIRRVFDKNTHGYLLFQIYFELPYR